MRDTGADPVAVDLGRRCRGEAAVNNQVDGGQSAESRVEFGELQWRPAAESGKHLVGIRVDGSGLCTHAGKGLESEGEASLWTLT